MICSLLASSSIDARFAFCFFANALYTHNAMHTVIIVVTRQRKRVDAVGPWSSNRWNPELDCIEVGLSIRTFGVAATAGTDDVAPILLVSDVDSCNSSCDLDIGCPGGDVVPWRSSGHRFFGLL